jgi:hypothetical protein
MCNVPIALFAAAVLGAAADVSFLLEAAAA